jgi:LysR family transcriptional regulator, glycine cleavage system transcriptional activator
VSGPRRHDPWRHARAGGSADGASAFAQGLHCQRRTVVGARWLLPRIDRFRADCPGTELRIDATERLAEFEIDEIDMAVRFGRGDYPGLISDALMPAIAFPGCSLALLRGDHPLNAPRDLARHTLLHARWTEDDRAPSWRMWLTAAGVPELLDGRGLTFSTVSLALQAALDGHGVALATGPLIRRDLDEGRLVRPFETALEPPDFGYYLVYPERSAGKRNVQDFRAWMFAEIAREQPEPTSPERRHG